MVVHVGLVGTGYAARKRAEALRDSDRAQLVAVSGQCDRAEAIAHLYRDLAYREGAADDFRHVPDRGVVSGVVSGVVIEPDWQTLVQRRDIDLVVVATRNHLHGIIVQAALTAGKHVVVEYPLALEVPEAEALVELGRSQQRLLHVEHIERLSGIQTTIEMALPKIGMPCYCHSTSFKGERSTAQRWSYNALEFGFPFIGALSRIQRLVSLFGPVDAVNCNCQYWNSNGQPFSPSLQQPRYAAVLCSAHLFFKSGLWVEVTYGKGECFWSRERRLDIHGTEGRLLVEPQGGQLIDIEGSQPLTVGSRRGLFAKDTAMVLDALENHQPLYITPEESVYALKVADAARRSAESGKRVKVGEDGNF